MAQTVIDSRLVNSLNGGLWVGGKATLSPARLTFVPNAVNQALHSSPNQLNLSVPLTEIVDLQVRRGLITDVIDVQMHSGNCSFRCFKAKAFAVEIEQACAALPTEASSP